MSVLDRSWYGRVLVERVERLVGEEVWRRAYEEIASFERSLVLERTVLIKFWLHISSREQLKRFMAREADPLKSWKLTGEDWRNRDRRADYEQAVEDMLRWTDLPHAPWHLIEGDSKRYARVKVAETVVAELEAAVGR